MKFEVDDAGTAILVAMTGLFWFITFGTSSSPSAAEMVIVLAFTLLTLTQTGTISLGTRSRDEPARTAERPSGDRGKSPAADGGEPRSEA